MRTEDQGEYERFIHQRRDDLKRIARNTRGEYQLLEVENEAWLLAHDMQSSKGISIDFVNRDYQNRLLSHLYQRLVRYSEPHVRHAIRLDHGSTDDDENLHPLMRMLASDDGRDALADLVAREAAIRPQEIETSHSLAAAYAYLLGQFDNNVKDVADFLLISTSAVRRHYTEAIWLARHQLPIPLDHLENSRFKLKPWRRFCFQRNPVQLKLPFAVDESLHLISETA